jgi:glycosyltransferase
MRAAAGWDGTTFRETGGIDSLLAVIGEIRGRNSLGHERGVMNVAILTAARNPGPAIRSCLASVAGQTVPPGVQLKHCVRDGGSTDGTVAILADWVSRRTDREFVSQADGGFYSAINSGLERCPADLIGILNADDFYFDHRVIRRMVEAFRDPAVALVYGDLVYVREEPGNGRFRVQRFWRTGQGGAAAMRSGWMPPHPTVFVRREVFSRCGVFRTDLGSAADYEWLVRVIARFRMPLAYVPGIAVAMRTGGMSNASLQARWTANGTDRRAWALNGLRPTPGALLWKPLRKIPQWLTARSAPEPERWFEDPSLPANPANGREWG